MSLQLILTAANAKSTITRITSFTFEKEVYTPYSQLTLSAYGTFSMTLLADTYRVAFYTDDTLLHFGTVEQMQITQKNGVTQLRLTSRGLTAMLLQNQLAPGLHNAMSLDKLMTDFYTLPEEITWEASADTSNYLYVKQNASMWDGIVNLTYKLCQRYPYIYQDNEIRMTPPDTYQHFSATDATTLLQVGMVTDQSMIYSDFYMADADGTYGAFHESDTEAASRGIVRTKQLALDNQYLYDPQQALVFRRKFADRQLVRYFVEINGASTLSIGDRLSYGDVLDSAMITRVYMTGNKDGVRTRLEAYLDAFYSSSD